MERYENSVQGAIFDLGLGGGAMGTSLWFFHNPQPYQLSPPAASAWQERIGKNLGATILGSPGTAPAPANDPALFQPATNHQWLAFFSPYAIILLWSYHGHTMVIQWSYYGHTMVIHVWGGLCVCGDVGCVTFWFNYFPRCSDKSLIPKMKENPTSCSVFVQMQPHAQQSKSSFKLSTEDWAKQNEQN